MDRNATVARTSSLSLTEPVGRRDHRSKFEARWAFHPTKEERFRVAFVFAVPLLLVLGALVVGALTGRIQVSSCCGVADPRKDLRMRAAFADETIHEAP